jgi:GntR family transcriptional regulator, carbon starvation induced regulator
MSAPRRQRCKSYADKADFIDKVNFIDYYWILVRGRKQTAYSEVPCIAVESSDPMKVQSRARAEPELPKPMAADPLSAQTLTEHVLQRLRDDIVSGTLAASEKLRVQDLSRRYGVGASPLREALSRLTADGLVANESNRGFRVAPMSVAEFIDVAENRRRIESLALEQSIKAGDDAWEGRLIADYHQLRKLEATHRPNSKLNEPTYEWERRHRSFHQSLIAACPSPWLLHFDWLLVCQFDRYRRLVILNAGSTRAGRQQEQALVDAALTRDAKTAVQVLCEHIDDSAAQIVRQLRERL